MSGERSYLFLPDQWLVPTVRMIARVILGLSQRLAPNFTALRLRLLHPVALPSLRTLNPSSPFHPSIPSDSTPLQTQDCPHLHFLHVVDSTISAIHTFHFYHPIDNRSRLASLYKLHW